MKHNFKKATSWLLTLAMIVTMLPAGTLTAFAAEDTGLCEHHPAHTAECGYVAAAAEVPCGHEHTAECYTLGELPDADSGDVYDLGADTNALACQHVHDAECGYIAAVEAHECHYECAECAAPACTCGTEDESIHATDCPAYVAPETAVCTCVEQCTEDNANVWCDVCGFDASACTGTDMAAAYADSLTVTIGTGESVTLNDTDGDGYYEIGTADELYAFAAAVNQGNTSINGKLTANITVNENVLNTDGALNGDGSNFRAWTPIDNNGMYIGTFDGANNTISGLYFSDTNSYAAGLFGYVGWDEYADVCGTVKNVGVVNSYFSGKENVGGVVGNMPYGGAVENCYSSASVSGGNCVGGVVGYSRGTVRNCYNTGSVSGTGNYVGGVVGQNDGTVENCYNTGTVNGSQNVGGVIGTNRGTVENCYNTGSVSGTYYIGGVAGSNQSNAEVKNCYNTGTVSGTSDTGGVLGINNSGTVTNCYYLKDCATDGSGVAQQGIGAATQGSATEDVEDGTVTTGYYDFSTGEVCYKLNGDQSNIVFKQTIGTGTPTFTGSTVYYGYTSCLDEVMAYTNEVASDELKHNWENGRCMNDCGYTHTPHTWSDGICSECLLTCTHSAGWANGVCNECGAAHDPHSYENGFCTVCGSYEPAGGDGISSPYTIGNAGQLYWFADYVNTVYGGVDAVLTADITVNSGVLTAEGALAADTSSFKEWTPIGTENYKYIGTFDGQGHTISGLYFSNESTDYVGLFGYVQDSTVKNVGVVDSYFCGQINVGGVVGYCIASYSGSVSVENCYNTGIVKGTLQIGGVVGYLYSDGEGSKASIENCYNTGDVSGISSTGSTYVGGVVGYNTASSSGTVTVANCYNTGSVSGSTNSYYVGGVAGGNTTSDYGTVSITNCYYLTNCATNGDGVTQFGIGANTQNTATADDVSGKVTAVKDEETFKSGAVAYLLNGDDAGTDAGVWKQTLGEGGDDSPNFTGKTVYQSGTGYTNHEHNWSYADGAYAYQIQATCTAAGCTLTGRVTIILGALGGTYTGDAHTASVLADSSEFTVREDVISYTKDGTALSAGEVPTDAGTYKATLKLGNAEASVEYTIEQAPLTITAATIDSKTYDGTKTAVIDSVTLDGTKNSESLILGTDYEATAVFDNANAGDNKTVNVTVTLKDTPKAKNYTLSSGTYSLTDQTISKASLTPTSGNLEVTNGRAGSYTFSLSNLLPTLGDGQTYGDVTYTLGTVTLNESYYDSDTVSISGSILTLPIKAVESSTESEVGTIQITITSDNYTFTEATITVSAVNKEVPQGEPTLSKTTLTYGDKLSTITLSGSMTDTNGNPVTGTFTWENPDAVPTVATTSVTWKFTPENSDAYAEVTGTANIVVNKAASSVSTAPTGAADLTYTGSGQNLLSDKGTAQGGEMQFSLEQNGNYSADIPTGTNAGDYTVWYKVVGDANHKDTAPLSLSVNIKGAAPVIGWQKDSDRKTYDGSAATLLVQATVTLVNNETYAEATHGSLSYTWYTDANCTVKTGTMDNSGASGEGAAPVNAGTYYVKASLAAKGNYAAADSSALTYTIDKNTDTTAPALGVGYTIDYVNESITIASGYSVNSDFNTSSATTVNSGSISSYIGTAAAPGILYIQRAADQNHVASAWTEISLSRPAAPTGLAMSAETIQGVTDAMEYSVDGGTTWTAVPAGQTQITGLTGNTTVQVRFKATDSAFCSELITNPTCTAPTGLTATYGDLLSSVALTNPDGNTPGEWKWTDSDPNTTVGDAGDKAISATFTPADGNYMTKIVAVTVTVSPVEVTVTADAKSKTYGEDNPALTYKVSGLIGQDTLSGSLTTTAEKMSNVGEYDITVGDLANSNYTISYTGAKLTITKAASSVTIAPVAVSDLTYKGGEQDLITAGTADGGTMQYSLDNSTWSPAIPTGTNAGSYTVYYKVVGDINHDDVAAQSVSVTIAPKTVTTPAFDGLEAQYVHTGSAIEPTFTLKDGETTIPASEYTVAYSNNVSEGTATITITDKDGGNYTVSGSKTFQIVVHVHEWTYSASDDTITAKCEGTIGDCPVTGKTVTIVLTAPTGDDLKYTGSEKSVSVTQTPAGVFTDIPDVAYTGDRKSVGTHTATLTYGGKTAEVSFTIVKATRNISAPALSGDAGVDTITLTAGTPSAGTDDGTVEYGWSATNSADGVTNWQTGLTFTGLTKNTTYYFFARVTDGTNFGDATSTGTQIKTALPEYTVSFNVGKGQTPVADQTIQEGSKVTSPSEYAESTTVTVSGVQYRFDGWYSDADCTREWDFGTNTVTGEMMLYAKWVEQHTVHVVVNGQANVTYGSFSASLVAVGGATTEITDIAGPGDGNAAQYSFTLTVDAGQYNLVVKATDTTNGNKEVTATSLEDLRTADQSDAVTLPESTKNSVVEGSTSTGIIAGGVNEIAASTPLPAGAESITVSLTVADQTEQQVGTETVEQIESVAQGQTIGKYLDIGLFYQVDSGEKNDIGDSNGKIIELLVPYDTSKKDITVYRVHNGKPEALGKGIGNAKDGEYFDYTVGDGFVTIHAKRFSDYAIGHTEDTQYTITLNAGGGTLSGGASAATGTDGKLAVLPANPTRSGYTFNGWYDAATGGNKITTDTEFTENTTIYAQWTQNSSGGGGGYVAPTYSISVESTENGEIKANRTYASYGSTVTITVTPDEGYKLESLTVTTASGKEIEVTAKGDGTYTFKMPSGKVTVTPVFVSEGTSTGVADCPKDDTCPVAAFTDADPGAWYHDGIHYALENGMMAGYGNGLFGTNDSITRGQIVTILWRLEGSPVVNYLMNFEDVPAEKYYTEAIRWANSQGIVGGYGNGKFGPDDPITRQQLATMVYRYEQYKGGGFTGAWAFRLDFKDIAEMSDYAYEPMCWCVMNGIVGGYGNGYLGPNDGATRAQAAAMLMRYCTLNNEEN